MYEVKISSQAAKYFKKIKDKHLKQSFFEAINKIAKDPYIGSRKKGDLAGLYGFDVRYDGINYEIAYWVEEINGKLVVIVLAGTRENFYDELKRIYNSKIK